MPDAAGCTDYDVIVLGAGISGLVTASVLAAQGNERVLVADVYDHVGGNHIDFTSGPYTFDIGSLIFQDDSPLLKHFPEMLPAYVVIDPSWGRLNPQKVVTRYPISIRDDVLAAGPAGVSRILASAIYARVFQRNMNNAKEFARYWIGGHLLHRSGLEAYMTRFYGVDPADIDIDLAQKRMRWISENASVLNQIKRRLDRTPPGPSNRQLARPREGFSHLYAIARRKLERNGATFLLGADLKRLERDGEGFRLAVNGSLVSSKRVISTIPINHAEALCGLPSQPLRSITLISLYFSFSGRRGFEQSVLYNFSHTGSWKRITVYSDFYGRANAREYFTVEVVSDRLIDTVEKAEADFRRHVAENDLLRGDLVLEGSASLDNAYPVYSDRSAERAAEAIARLEAFGVESFGRQGGFNYQPTARNSTLEAEIALSKAPIR